MATSMTKNYVIGKETYHKLDTNSESSSSLANFRNIFIQSKKAVDAKKAELTAAIQKIKETYVSAKAAPQIAELRKQYAAELKITQEKLSEKLTDALAAKERACKAYITTPPSADVLTLLQTLRMRDLKTVQPFEWESVIAAVSGNYQAAKVLEGMMKEAGQSFPVPFNAEQGLSYIQDFRELGESVIRNIESDTYFVNEFIRTDIPTTRTAKLIEILDHEIGVTVPAAPLTLANRLKAAANNALHQGDTALFNQIWDFIHDYKIQTPQEQEAEVRQQAEELITKGMNAKEPEKKDAYRQQLDKTISALQTEIDKG